MSLKDLEEKAVEIRIQGDLQKIVKIEGSVDRVNGFNEPIKIIPSPSIKQILGGSDTIGYQKKLQIVLDSKTSTHKISLLKFKGTSPVRDGDRIKAGLILDEYFERHRIGNILYLGMLKQDGSFGRIDYMDGYNPTHGDASKLRLP